MNEEKKYRYDVLYLIAYALLCFMTLSGGSQLIKISEEIKLILYSVIIILFSIKIILNGITKKEIIILVLFGLMAVYTYMELGTIFFITNLFAIMALKKTNVTKIVKVDIIIKLLFLIMHSIFYFTDIMFGDTIKGAILYRGTMERHSLYFTHPNIVALMIFWLIVDIAYLKKKLTIRNIIFFTILISIIYFLTNSRTILAVYIVFLCIFYLKEMKNKAFSTKMINFMYKYIFEIITILSILMATLYGRGWTFLDATFNALTSGRVYSSYVAVNSIGIHLFGSTDLLQFENLIVDNFYIRSAVEYGLIYVLILICMTKFNREKEKNITDKVLVIIFAVSLFSEYNSIIIGNAIPLLLLGNIVINNHKKEKKIEE